MFISGIISKAISITAKKSTATDITLNNSIDSNKMKQSIENSVKLDIVDMNTVIDK